MGTNADGRRGLVSLPMNDTYTESEPFWCEFLGSLKQRSLSGVGLLLSDVQAGSTKALGQLFQAAVVALPRALRPQLSTDCVATNRKTLCEYRLD